MLHKLIDKEITKSEQRINIAQRNIASFSDLITKEHQVGQYHTERHGLLARAKEIAQQIFDLDAKNK